MKVSTSKEKILKNIREALANPVPLPFPKSEGSLPVFPALTEDLEVLFAEEFTRLLGKFAFCIDEEDASAQIKNLITARSWKSVYCVEDDLKKILPSEKFPQLNTTSLADCEAAVTTCHYLVARTGAIVMSSAQQSGRTVSAYTPVHICVAYTDQVVFDTRDALAALKNKYGNDLPSFITFAAGPSRTADIEKTLVTGVHGPGEVYVFLIERPHA